MRSAAYLGVAILFILLQSNLFRLLDPLTELLGSRITHGLTPSLVLPFIIYLGVHEPSMMRGALLAFGLGYVQDILSGAPVGLLTFVSVAIWWLSRVAGVRLTAQTALPRMTLALLFAFVQSAIVLILLAVFGSDSQRPVEIGSVIVPQALSTALCAPLMFRIAQRLRPVAAPVTSPTEGNARVTILVQRSDVGEFRRRYRWMVLVVLAAFLILIGRLVQLQVVEGDVHRMQARRNIIRDRQLATTRGVIRDANGRVLSANRPSYSVYVTPATIDMEKVWPMLVKLVRLDDSDRQAFEAKIKERKALPEKEPRRTQQLLVKVDVDRDAVAYLETHEQQLIGVEVTPTPVRYYPYGELGAHLLGYMREVDREELGWLSERGYRSGDRTGAVGVERRWESYLRGQRGMRKVLYRPPKWQSLDELEAKYLEEPRRVEPVPGRDVSTTIDVELVAAIDKAMRGQLAGAVVVVDVRTGRIVAELSKPSFDPNVVSGGQGTKAVGDAFRRLNADPLKPTLDKTISAAYPPGSTYKPFTALAALSDGLIDPTHEVDCRGGFEYGKRYFRCTGVHRHVNLHEALVQSCNTYFYDIGSRISIDRLAAIGLDFGFGAKTGIGVNPEARGRMPTRGWYTRRYKEAFRGGFTLLSAIGQGASTVTVLQLALSYAALANGGTLYQPQVVRSIETSDGTVVQEFPPRVRRVVDLDAQQLSAIKSGLEGVVTERGGTAHGERIEGVDMAGKTGTAQVSHVTPRGVDPDKIWYFNRDHAWFAGYAPSRSPEIAIVVLVEHGGGGGKNAVPIAMRVVREWQRLKAKRLNPEPTATPAKGGP